MTNLIRAALFAVTLLGRLAIAEEAAPSPMHQGPSPEQRAAMADNHEQMSACLQSTRPVSECRQEMMQRAQQAAGRDEGKAPANKTVEMTAEQRGAMAKAHAAVASCLRAGRPPHECHAELGKACQETGASESCPMVGMGMQGMHMQATPQGK